MKQSDVLYDLIKSLTGNEKRFFKIYASRHVTKGKNNYVKFFEAIDKLKHYDVDKLKKIGKEPFGRYLSAGKNYLYNLILECLDIYHKNSSVDRLINQYTSIANILSEKRLDKQSLNMIKKAKYISEKYSRFEKIIPLLFLKRNIGFDRDSMTRPELESHYDELFKAIDRLKMKTAYAKIRDELLHRRKQNGVAKDVQEYEMLNKVNQNSYFRNILIINCQDVNISYLLAKLEYYRILRNSRKCRIYCNKLISIFNFHQNKITDDLSQYIYTLNVFIVERLYKNKEEAEAVVKKILSIPSIIDRRMITNGVEVKIFEVYYTGITDIALQYREYEKALLYVEEIEEGLKKLENIISPSFKLAMKSNVACVYFGAGRYKDSLKWCNDILNDHIQQRDDILYVVHILYLLIHFELKNHLILPSLIKSTYRFLYKKKRVYQFETLFFKYLHLFLRPHTKKEQIQLFNHFREELIPLKDNKLENLIFNDIDLIGWIDKKLGMKKTKHTSRKTNF